MDDAPTPEFQPWNIPDDLIQRWSEVPDGVALHVAISRATIDHLFFAIFGALNANAHLRSAVTAMGDDPALFHEQIRQADLAGLVALDRLRKFIGAIMQNAQPLP